MALIDKQILITPNIGHATNPPTVVFTGADAGSSISITATMLATGVLKFTGSLNPSWSFRNATSGDLFTIQNSTPTTIFNIDHGGNLTLLGTVDGRDIAADGALIDGADARYGTINDSPPGTPYNGQQWYQSSTGKFVVWTGAEWVELGAPGYIAASGVGVFIQDTQPVASTYVWFDTTGGDLQIWVEDGL